MGPAGAGHINIVKFPADVFHLVANQIRLPATAFTVGPNISTVRPYDKSNDGTEVLCTGNFM
jgi:hypothetical protein